MEESIKKILTKAIYGEADEVVKQAHKGFLDQTTKQLLSLFDEVVEGILGEDIPIDQPFDDKYDFVELNGWKIFRKAANWKKDQIKTNYSKLKESK